MNEISQFGAILTSVLSKTLGSKVKSAHELEPSVPKRVGHFVIMKTAIQFALLIPGQWWGVVTAQESKLCHKSSTTTERSLLSNFFEFELIRLLAFSGAYPRCFLGGVHH